MSGPLAVSSTSSLSSSPHVHLLVNHRARAASAHCRMTELVPHSPEKDAERSVDPAEADPLPLPRVWAAARARALTLPSEERILAALHVETSDPHLLRRGLYVACAAMYFPAVLGTTHLQVDSVDHNDDADRPNEDEAALSFIRVPSGFSVSVVQGGITNLLYKCALSSHPDQPVLVRIYGPRTELVIDRSNENVVVDVLSRTGGGPKIHGRFANGRLESWLAGESLTPDQMREPHISALIAGSLARLHVTPMPPEFPREPVIARVLRQWSTIASEVAFPDDPAKQKQLDALDLPGIIVATDTFLARSATSHYGSSDASRLVFAHNDLLSGNLLYDSERNTMAVIDFEYGNYNPRGFDLANHFCECCGFDCDWSVFPTQAAQLHFIRAYLASLADVTPAAVSADAVADLYAEVQCWLVAPHLFWLMWACVQARHSPIDFDYLTYALMRRKGYEAMQQDCEAWLGKSPKEVSELQLQ